MALKNNPNTWGIIILRGPRQIGKTTLVFYLAYRGVFEYGLDPRSVIYIDLSYWKLKQCIERGLLDLVELIRRLLENKKRPILLIIDEASLFPEWSLVIKNLVEYNVITNGVATIVTGSHAVELAVEQSHLIGRYGPLCRDSEIRSGPRQYYYPLRFSEFAESLFDEVNQVFRELNLRVGRTKYAVIRYVLDPNMDPDKIRILKELRESYLDVLQSAFKHYILLGGYPFMTAFFKEHIDEVLSKGVPADLYQVIYSGLMSDINKFSKYMLREEVFRELTKSISERHIEEHMGLEVNYNDLAGLIKHIGKASSLPYRSKNYTEVLRAHLDYLAGIKAVIEVKPLKFSNGRFIIESGKPLAKLIFIDPSIAISVYAFTHNIPDPYKHVTRLLENGGLPSLVEAITLAHLIRIPQLLSPGFEELIEPIGYLVKHREVREDNTVKYIRKGEIDGITWFYSYSDAKHVYIPVEVKHTPKEAHIDDNKVEVLRGAPPIYSGTRLILTVAFDLNDVYQDEYKSIKYIVIPLPLFLAII